MLLMGCDLCGYEGPLVNAVVEGSVLTVCKKCSAFGDVITIDKPHAAIKKPTKIVVEEPRDLLVDDYAARVKTAREHEGLTQQDLARKLNEKESVIHQVESGHLRPSFALAKKIEKILVIHLIEAYEEPSKVDIDLRNANLTIGDLIKIRKKTT